MNELNQTDQTLHSLAQLIALTAMQCLPIRADDSQTNLIWNSDQHRLEGQPFTQNGRQLRLIIDLQAFALQFIDESDYVTASFSPEGRTPADAMTWWKSQMKAWGATELRELNYHLDHEPVTSQTVYEQPAALKQWAEWRTIANNRLSALNEWSGQGSEIRVWPHHFDTGIYYAQTDANGQEKAAIWAGYAIADAVSDEPYFYLSGYKSGEPVNFSAAPPLATGEWRHTSNWKGALLPISQAADEEHIAVFFQESYAWLQRVLASNLPSL